MKKNIVHLSSRYSNFGAFNASRKIYDIIRKNKKINNYYLTGRIDTLSTNIKSHVKHFSIFNNKFFYKINYYIDAFINIISQRKITNNYWSNNLLNFNNTLPEQIKKADLIILYWVNDGFLSLKNLKDIFNLNIPVIWRFSDMWPFTGGCHYSYNCEKFIKGCHTCPQLSKFKFFDLAKFIFKKKMEWNLHKLTIITPSSFLEKKIRNSKLFKYTKIYRLINSVDTNFYNYKKKSTKLKKIKVLVGPFNKQDYTRKGHDYFEKILHVYKNYSLNNIEFHTYGSYKSILKPKNLINHGFISNKSKLKKIYQKADIYLFLSKQDNSPNTVAEALSCGTPIITFKNNGADDYCKNTYNSIILKEFDANLILYKIFKLHKEKNLLKKLSINSRKSALKYFSNFDMEKKINKIINKLINE
jgi:glycosyltransferase involved in cell wall biosynthesis